MISVSEALELIANYHRDFGTELVPLLQSGKRILAENILADRDFPPYHRVTMDGIAINSAAFANGNRKFRIAAVQPAGHPIKLLENDAECIEVMTGATLPANTDAIVPYEDCAIMDGVAIVQTNEVSALQNIHVQGTDAKQGQVLLEKGQRITPAMTGILASVGKSAVPVYGLPRVAVCATGDELVPVDENPEAHQVRRSNVYMLTAALQEEGIVADTFHFTDDKEVLTDGLKKIKKDYDVMLLSGAVSKGKYDHLPEVLDTLGMETVFHRVAQKPGKPMLFGAFKNGPLVFGLPGNPASSLVCYQVFFKAWLYGCLRYFSGISNAKLSEDVSFKPTLTYHLLVKLEYSNGECIAVPMKGANSGDAVNLTKTEGLVS